MKDEIKEILEDYKNLAGKITEKLDNTATYENWLIIQEYFDKLLDYITNLQQENERLKEELEDETLNKEIAQGHRKQIQDIELQERKEKEDYKSRCEKAIEYLEKWGEEPDADMYIQMKQYKDFQNLLNILNGGDKE